MAQKAQQAKSEVVIGGEIQPERSRYARVLAEAGMFTDDPEADSSSPTVDRTYEVDDLLIHHTGPRLSLVDEDTFIAIIQLSRKFHTHSDSEVQKLKQIANQHNLEADRKMLALPGTSSSSDDLDIQLKDEAIASALKLDVKLVGRMSYRGLNLFLGKSDGKSNRALRQASVDRLSQTMISITRNGEQSSPVPLINTKRSIDNPHEFKVSYSPEIQSLLADYIEIDVNLRRKLSNVGKNLHRILTINGFPHRAKGMYEAKYNILKFYLGTRLKWGKFRDNLETGSNNRNMSQKGSIKIMQEADFVGKVNFLGKGGSKDPFTIEIHPPLKKIATEENDQGRSEQ